MLEELSTHAQFVAPEMGVYPQDAPDETTRVSIRFEAGTPVAMDGDDLSLLDIFERANAIGGANGLGIGLHTVENRFVGIKSRGVYEAPGMELLGSAYEYLLQLILDRRARPVFDSLSAALGRQIYEGYWYDLASTALRRRHRRVHEAGDGDGARGRVSGSRAVRGRGGRATFAL